MSSWGRRHNEKTIFCLVFPVLFDADFCFYFLFLRCYFIKLLMGRLSLDRLPPHGDFYDLVGASMHVHVLRLLNLMSMAMRRVRQVRSWSDEGSA